MSDRNTATEVTILDALACSWGMLITRTCAQTGFKCILSMHKMCKQLSSKVHAPYPLLICPLTLIVRVMGLQLGEL